MRVSLCTLGCKLNQAESEELKKTLIAKGFSVVPFKERADVAIIRACAVTANASQTTRELIRQAKRRGAYVIASGCLENRDLPEIDFWARDEGEIAKQVSVIARSEATKQSLRFSNGIASLLSVARNDTAKTRAMIKIQTGCNFNCAYCVVPYFRGQSKSVPAEKIIQDIKEATKAGYKEIILTGVNICQYRAPSPSAPTLSRGFSPSGRGRQYFDLTNLLKKILRETKIERIRLGSLDPRLIDNELINLYSSAENVPPKAGPPLAETVYQCNNVNRLMPHWHLSLQSGSDSVLRRMNRGYTTKKYLAIVKKLRQANPLFSFTTDIIVGFPGETESDFLATVAFVKKIIFAKIHIFPYSPRPNTPAQKMTGQVQDKIKTERVGRLKKICEQAAADFAAKFIGQTRPVLFEPYTKKVQGKNKKSDLWAGYTPEYLRVTKHSNKNLKNQIKKIKIQKTNFIL